MTCNIHNGSDLVLKGMKFKITIKDPNGKVLYQKNSQISDKIHPRDDSYKFSIFFDKPLKSKWTFQNNSHPLSFEIISLDVDQKVQHLILLGI